MLDLLSKRYGERPSTRIGFNRQYNDYYCFQFDLAVLTKGVDTEAKAQKDAMKKAKDEAATEVKAGEVKPDTPVLTPEQEEKLSDLTKEITIDGDAKKPDSSQMFKKISDIWQHKQKPPDKFGRRPSSDED